MRNKVTSVCAVLTFYIVIATALCDPKFEIRAGNCSAISGEDLVWKKHCNKYGIIFFTRYGTERYSGMRQIYCVVALSRTEEHKGSTVEIINGGVRDYSVEFEMKSAFHNGYDYDLRVYAK